MQKKVEHTIYFAASEMQSWILHLAFLCVVVDYYLSVVDTISALNFSHLL